MRQQRNIFFTKAKGLIRARGLLIFALSCLFSLLFKESYAAVFTSAANGNWSTGATWVGGVAPGAGDDAIIAAGTNVTASNNSITNVTINSGAVLSLANAKNLNISGNLIINGTITGGTNTKITLTGAGMTIDGLGSITLATGILVNANVSILSTANFIVDCPITLANNVVLTNNGIVTLTSIAGNNIIGGNASSEWVNAASSYLKFANAIMTTGKLTASGNGNTVEYYGATQTIRAPTTTYYNLKVSTTGTKTLGASITLDGSLTINSCTLDASTFDLSLKGDWTNTGTFTEQTRTVTFNGTSNQTITNSSDETFYDLTKSSTGTIVLANNVIVANTLTMTAGNINAQSYTITLGTGTGGGLQGTLSYTAGSIIGNFERWIIATATPIVFPVGTSAYVCTATPTFTNLNSGSLIVSFSSSAPGNNGLSLVDGAETIYNSFVEGYWTFTSANSLTSNNYDLQLSGAGFTSFPIIAATRILTRTNSGNPWTANGTHVDAVGTDANRSALSGADNQFCLGDNTNCTAPSTSVITGTSSVCTSQSGVAYSVTDTPGSTYAWTIIGGVQASGTNTNSITVDWGATGMMGNVRVVESNACTDGAPVDFVVTIASLPSSSITGSANVAENTTGVPYSVTNTAGYTYAWNITGGVQASGTNTNSITVDWGAAGAGEVSVTATDIGCGTPSTAVTLDVNVYVVINSIATGQWSSAATWDCSCVPASTNNVRVRNGHTITFPNGTAYSIVNLNIDAGGTINNTSNRTFTTSGDFVNNGTYTGNIALILSGSGSSIDGTGTISLAADMTITTGNKTILSAASLTRSAGTTTINSGLTITNNGSFTLTSDMIGAAASSTWVNAANSTLNINGGTFLATGTMTSTASGNIIGYGEFANQTIRVPTTSSKYYHLTLSGGSVTKTLAGNITIDGTFTNTAILDQSASNYSISIAGDWITNSAAPTPMVSRSGATVTFNGTGAQQISSNATVDFNNIVIEKTAGTTLTVGGGTTTLTTLNLTETTGNFTPPATLTIAGNLVLTAGTFTAGSTITITGNWTNNSGGFIAGSNTVTFNGTAAAQTIAGSSATSFYNLTTNNSFATSPQLSLGISIPVDNTLTMTAGNIDLATFDLTLGTSDVLPGALSHNGTAAAGWMYGTGNFIRWFSTATLADGAVEGLFPIGSSVDFRPFYIAAPITGPSAGGTLSMKHVEPGTGSTAVSFADGASTIVMRNNQNWVLTAANSFNIADNNLDIRIEGTGFGVVGNVNDLRIVRVGDVIGTAGTNGGITSNPIVRRDALPAFTATSNTFYIGSVDGVSSPLPIRLLSFEATVNEKIIDLTWITASETNNEFFTIERTTDGIHFTEITRVAGAGNSIEKLSYVTYDTNPLNRIAYYRLKQTDFDGKFTYSQLVAVNINPASEFAVNPNPVSLRETPNLNMVGMDVEKEILVIVYDMNGNEAYSKIVVTNTDGTAVFATDPSNTLKKGIYVITATSDQNMYRQKLVIQ